MTCLTQRHRGVLFLDELPEFGQAVLEVLRQLMEDRMVTISRSHGTTTFPSDFMLVAATNLCPCGFYGDQTKECTCSESGTIRTGQRVAPRCQTHLELVQSGRKMSRGQDRRIRPRGVPSDPPLEFGGER